MMTGTKALNNAHKLNGYMTGRKDSRKRQRRERHWRRVFRSVCEHKQGRL